MDTARTELRTAKRTRIQAWPQNLLASTSDFGEISVEVLDVEGQRLARSKPVQQDGLDIRVEWQEEFAAPDQPVVLRFALKNARLFAIWCR